MNPLRLDDLVAAVGARLRVAFGDCVFAVWPDGSVSEELPGFVDRTQLNGHTQVPLAIFASKTAVTKSAIRARISDGMRARGLREPD